MAKHAKLAARSADKELLGGRQYRCGVGTCQPSGMQRCANIKMFCVVLSLVMLLQFVFYSYSTGVLRTQEKRFGLPSTTTGLIMSVSDIVQTFFVLFVAYIGGRTHKPRLLSIGCLTNAIAIFLSAVPYFIYGPYQYNNAGALNEAGLTLATNATLLDISGESLVNVVAPANSLQICQNVSSENTIISIALSANSSLSSLCSQGDDGSSLNQENTVAIACFFASSILLAFGTSGFFVLGFAYIDENVKADDSALYIGLVASMFSWGPIIGFSAAAFSTRLPEDLGEFKVSPYDPEFIGCWWLGHVVVSVLLAIVSIPMFMFPKHFPGYYIYCKTDKSTKVPSSGTAVANALKAFPIMFWKLMLNPRYVLLVFSKVFAIYYIVGIIINQTRYVEIHFGQPAFVANITAAVCGAVTGAFGKICGGVLIKKFKMGARGISLMFAAAMGITFVGIFTMMAFPCPQRPTAYDGNPMLYTGYTVDLPCSMNCSCSRDQYRPVCTPEGVEYFSPCHAGCPIVNGTHFSGCSCVPGFGTVSAQWCLNECESFPGYAAIYAVVSFVAALSGVPSTVLTFRVVEPHMKTFALGLTSCLMNMFGFVPGPVVFGALFDSACRIWKTVCGERMSCLVYDNTRYRYYMNGVSGALVFVSFILAVALYINIRFRSKLEQEVPNSNNEVPDDGIDANEDAATELTKMNSRIIK